MTQPASKRLLTEDRAALASNATPAAPGTGAPGSATSVSRSDHVHPSVGVYAPWGSGFDGDLVFDGTTAVVITDPNGNATLTPSGSVYTVSVPIAARTITISNGVTLKLDQGCTLMVRDLLTCPSGSCIISADGNAGAANGTVGATRAASFIAAAGPAGAGNTGAGSTGATTGGASDQYNAALGGSGGLGSSGAGGGTGGGVMSNQPDRFVIRREPMCLFNAYLHGSRSTFNPVYFTGGSGGGGGGGDGTNKGGGGGSGAGLVLVNARKIVGNITFRALGGNGGSPSTGNAGGGGGGGGGWVIVNSTDLTGYTGPSTNGTGATYAKGGLGGTKNGTGVNGSAGGDGYVIVTTWA